MSQPAVSSLGALDASPQPTNYYLWEEPERGIRIHLNPETVDRLQLEVLRSAAGFPSNEMEVGGILIGRTHLDGERTITVVEDFTPVPCSHCNGPLYRLSQTDLTNFEATMARCSSDTRGFSIVGYYRSHHRDDLYLSSDDLHLIQKYFPEPDKVFLLVKSLPSRACTAGFFFWEDGRIQSEFTYLEVPFGPVQSFPPGELTHPPAVRIDDRLSRKEETFPKKLPVVQSLRLAEPAQRNRRVWLMRGLAVAVVAVVLTLAGLSYWQSSRSKRQEISALVRTSLGLRVQRQAGSLTLTWNTNSRELQGAEEAILYINDGGTQQALHLDPKLLRGGALSFVPSSDDVELRFEVDRGGKPAAEDRVHLLLPNVPVEVPLHEAAQNSKKTQAVLDLKKAVAAAAKPGPSDRAQRGQPNETPAPATPRPVQFVAPARSIHPSISDVQFDQPPSIPIEAKYSDLIVTAPVVRPEAPIAQNEAAIVPVKPAAPTKVVPSQPTRVTSFVGPHVIRQVNPSIPMELRARITPDTQIEVALTIDTNGNVTDAKIASMKGAATGFISAEVLRAARLFQFRPAQENNRNIESQMVLTFRFGPVGK